MNTQPTPETDESTLKATNMEDIKAYKQFLKETNADLKRERDEWKAKYIQQNKDLGCELRDPNGTIWDHAKTLQRERDEARAESIRWQSIAEGRGRTDEDEQLAIVTAQRDRLAEALKEIYNVSSFDYDTMPKLARKKYREVVLEMADEALQSLTPKAEP